MTTMRQAPLWLASQNCAGFPTDDDGNQDRRDTRAPRDGESHEYVLFLPDRYSESDSYAPTTAPCSEHSHNNIYRSWYSRPHPRAFCSAQGNQSPLRKTICETVS